MPCMYVTDTASRRTTMNPNSEEFLNFLRSMGVDMERSQEHSRHESQPPREPRDPDVLQEEPAITILQQSRERDAFYQLNLIQTIPQLRVVLPEKEGMLKFQIYLVLFSGQHPLASIFSLLASYSGSWTFEHERELAMVRLLQAAGELLKDLFWTGVDTVQFPPEITVLKLL